MTGSITGNGPSIFMQTAKEIKSNAGAMVDTDSTIRAGHGKGVYGHSNNPFIKIKDALRSFFTPDAQKDRVEKREERIQNGAQKVFDTFADSYGKKFAQQAFKTVGITNSFQGVKNDRGEVKTVVGQGSKVTMAQLDVLEFMAKKFEGIATEALQQEQVYAEMVGSKLLNIEMEGVVGPDTEMTYPNDQEFKDAAKTYVSNFIDTYSKFEININHAHRKNIVNAAGVGGSKIDDMSHDELMQLRDLIKLAYNENERLINNNIVDLYNKTDLAADPNTEIMTRNINYMDGVSNKVMEQLDDKVLKQLGLID